MQNSIDIDDFRKSFEKNEGFNVILCTNPENTSDCLPSAYINEKKFILEKPLPLPLNIKLNFLSEIRKFINNEQWTIIVTKEGIFNRASNVNGFTPIRKGPPNDCDLSKILELFKEESSKMPKALIFLNLIYAKQKDPQPALFKKLKTNLDNYDSKLKNPLEIPTFSNSMNEKTWKELKTDHKSLVDSFCLILQCNAKDFWI